MTDRDAINVLEEVKILDDTMYAYSPKYLEALDIAISVLQQSEIIRCKDCIMHGVCRFEQGLGLDGYCSQAERREEK